MITPDILNVALAALPVTVLVVRGLAGSSVMAGSWRCSPESRDPEKRAATPHLDWPGCWGGLTG